MVSIGPYNHPNPNLKVKKTHNYPTPTWKPWKTISWNTYKQNLKPVKCYSKPIDLTPEQFIEMMLIDGFFIVEYFPKFSKAVLVDENDPIFNSKLIAERVVRDLVLLENQIPFSYPKNASTITHKHLVDLLSYTLFYSLPEPSTRVVLSTAQESLPSVMELRRSGVKFKKGSISKTFESLIHIRFHKGIFGIPPLCSPHITSYAILMDYLINSANDVILLRDRKIIINLLGNDEKVSSLFSSLCNGISSNGFCYDELCNEVNVFYNNLYHNWKATFKRNYCSNPWSIISVCTTFVLLFLTT
ncbi:hypothetical protein NE237_008088 [Protea cynaroides]|uniref:Uncharacterized protein n=1 Tax=Protea cynaroides TaxID=273540 RepID=A0A9Q0KQR4_9MAGN|nr:hypothetical protein NE237_008088 [Protea cynaroides]